MFLFILLSVKIKHCFNTLLCFNCDLPLKCDLMDCNLPKLIILICVWSCVFSICSYYFITLPTPTLLDKSNLPMELSTEQNRLASTWKDNDSLLYEPTNIYTPVDFNATLTMQLKEALNRSQKKEFTILIWAAMYGRQTPHTVDPSACGRCRITYDRSTVSEPNTKAVIFHFSDFSLNKMPPNRRTDQLYGWWTIEASSSLRTLRRITLDNLDGFFNITVTYRSHSDVYFPYFTAKDVLKSLQKSNSGDPQKDIDDLMSQKTGLALWAVSNCGITSFAQKRMEYSSQLLKAGLILDRVGKCFFKKRLRNVKMAKNYKFYMSFENGYHCKDYITEKFFENALLFGAVPVVFGAKKIDYQTFAPPNSFIFAEDFETPAKLVEYLNYLDKNDTAYKEYFKWRTMSPEDMPQPYRSSGFCHLCRILHGINVDNIYNPMYNEFYSDIPLFGYPQIPRIVDSLTKFFYESEDRECLPNY